MVVCCKLSNHYLQINIRPNETHARGVFVPQEYERFRLFVSNKSHNKVLMWKIWKPPTRSGFGTIGEGYVDPQKSYLEDFYPPVDPTFRSYIFVLELICYPAQNEEPVEGCTGYATIS